MEHDRVDTAVLKTQGWNRPAWLRFVVLAEEFEHVRHAAHDDAAVIQSGHFLVIVRDVL